MIITLKKSGKSCMICKIDFYRPRSLVKPGDNRLGSICLSVKVKGQGTAVYRLSIYGDLG